MKYPPLHFRKLAVHRMYGTRFDGLAIGDLCDGLNIIYGPNAVGKTTLARALRLVLWPDEDAAVASELEAHFSLEGISWRAEVRHGRVHFYCDGQEAERPPLPGSELRERYYLHLHELLRKTGDEGDFAQIIMRDAQGGFDVMHAAEALHFKEVRPRSGATTRAAEDAERALKKVLGQQDELQREQRRLESLGQQLEEARQARAQVELLGKAIALVRARDEERQARAVLEALPDVLAEMTGEEAKQLEEVQRQFEEAVQERDKATVQADKAKGRMVDSRIPEEGLPDGLLTALSERARRVAELEKQIDELKQQHVALLKSSEDEARRLQIVEEETAAAIDLSNIRDVASLGRRAERVRSQKEALSSVRGLLSDDEPQADPNSRVAAELLHKWLRAGRPEPGAAARHVRIVLIVVLVLIAASSVAAFLAGFTIALAAVLLALLLGVAIYMLRTGAAGDDKTTVYQNEFSKLGVQPPARWEAEMVVERLDELFKEQATLSLQERLAHARKQVAREDEAILDAINQLDEARKALARQLGLAPEVLEEELVLFTETLARWQKAHTDLHACKQKIDEAERQHEEKLQTLGLQLEPFRLEPPADAAAAHAHTEVLREEHQAFETARQEHKQAQENGERAAQRAARAEASVQELYARLQLDEGNEAGLRELVEERETYSEAKTKLDGAKAVSHSKHADLEAHALYEPRWAEKTEESLVRHREEAGAKAEKENELRTEIDQIKERIHAARKANDLEEAYTVYEEKLEDLLGDRERDYRATAGWLLARHVREKTHDEELPAVFHRARELFTTITAGRYRLDFDKQAGTFRAFDTVHETGLTLEALSSGTRVQLLLAVRIAFVEQQEHLCSLPLVLDETLANSDNERSRAIMEAVLCLCEEGRQVFYFTAQDAEVAKWTAMATEKNTVAYQLLPLDKVTQPSQIDSKALPVRMVSEVPPPDENDHDAYAKVLKVPAWDGYMPVGRLHLWYLVEDPEVLHRLLRSGIAQWGQLKQLAAAGALSVSGLDDAQFKAIEIRVRAVSAWQQAWRQGRGRKVDAAALVASEAISETFMERIAELCENVRGDGERLLERLRNGEVDRFRNSKIDDLEEYFRRSGYVKETDPLSQEEIWSTVLTALHTDADVDQVAVRDIQYLLTRLHDRISPRLHSARSDSEPAFQT